MTAEADQSVLRRKASARQSAAGPTAMDTAKAARFAVAKAGDDILQVAIGTREVSEDTLLPDDLDEGLPEDPIFLLVQDDLGAVGVAIGCQQTIAAVVEASTIGTVLPVEATPRRPTRTDAALLGEFLDAFLQGFAMLAELCEDKPPVEGFQIGSILEDARAAKMALADDTHRRYKFTLDFALGAKVGTLLLVIPYARKQTPSAVKSAEEWSTSLEKVVSKTTAHLDAVLGSMRLPLSAISNLSVGDVVPLPDMSINSLSLIGNGGRRISKAKLGRAGPARAVRVLLNQQEDEAPSMDDLAAQVATEMALPAPVLDSPGLPGPEPLGGMGLDLEPEPAGLPSLGEAELDPPSALPDIPGLGGIDLDVAGADDGGPTLGAIEPLQLPESDVIPG